ncbi:N-acetylmuramoyl-L-alanine amidase family protein [Salibacterium lacus]|uniref:N-acetylmuramoyl-L-alanine amidase n=1 Tax=Salibacterium lacus TaxID=1898109 RepID=A0ABW5SWE4_9BACI
MPMIALDIGHGSDTFPPDKGIYRNGKAYPEHEFNSDVAMRLQDILERHGISVWLPQPPNSKEVSLTTRVNAANRRDVDLYWSIHANAGGACGVCSFYWYTSNTGKRLAKMFAKHMEAAGFETHGDGTHASMLGSWTNLYVCRKTSMTAVLTENGFMDDDGDFQGIFGKDKEIYRQCVAETHAKILCEYFGIPYKSVKSKEEDDMNEVLDGNTKAAWTPTIKRWADPEQQRNPIGQSWVEKIENDEMTYSELIRLMGEERKRGLA